MKNEDMNDHFLYWEDIFKIFNTSETTVNRRISEKKFPKKVHPIPGSRRVGWLRSEIQLFIQGKWKYEG